MSFLKLLPRYQESQRMQGSFTEQTPNRMFDEEGVASAEPLDPLSLDIKDEDLCEIVDDWVGDYKSYYEEEYQLFDRRDKNELYIFGRQVQEKEKEKLLKDYESRFQNNVLFEVMGTLKPLAMSRLPDLMVTPGNDTEEATLMAQEVSKAIDTEIKERQNRFVLGLAFKHLPVYFTAVIKVRWDPEIDDYIFENIHPELIEVDHTSPTKDADKMKFISHIQLLTVQDVALRFPKKKEEFFAQMAADGIMPGGKETFKALATEVRIREVWFTEYVRHSDTEVEKVDGVLWKYKDIILHKMKNPNFDYEGETRFFAYDTAEGNSNGAQPKVKRALNGQELSQILLTGQPPSHVKEEQVYHNYFKNPRKPFYFFGYDQWGKQPYDETSWIEQNLSNQEAIDQSGKQIMETLKNRGHHVFAKSALTPADVEEMDMTAPNEDLSVEGDPRSVHEFIPPERPTAQEFQQMDNLKQNVYAVAHSNAIRGEIQRDTAATNTQIGRESDFTAADDLVEDTINSAGEWMAEWALQLIKLRYTKEHFRWIMGVAGEAVWLKLNRNMVDDGMIVKIKASGTDKLKAQNNAMEMGKMQLTDPYTFFVDMGLSDPEGRTEKLILAKTDPIAYLQKVVKGIDTSEALAQALMRVQQQGAQPFQPPQQQQPGQAPGQVLGSNPLMASQPGQQAPQPMPQQPSPQATGQVAAQPPAGPPAGSPRIL